MGVKYSNNAASTLSASITSSTTSFSVATGEGNKFPALTTGEYFYASLIDILGHIEVVKVTARSSDTFTVVRGIDSSTARAYSAGDKVELRITKAMLDDLRVELTNIQAISTAPGTLYGKTDAGIYSAPQTIEYLGAWTGTYNMPGTVHISVGPTGTVLSGNAYETGGAGSIADAINNHTLQVGQNLKIVVEIPVAGGDETGSGVYNLIDLGTITALSATYEWWWYYNITVTNPSGFDGTGATWRYPYHIYGFFVNRFIIGGTVAENVFLGNNAGVGVTTGGENVILGANAGTNVGAGRNNVVIGNAATASASGVDNEVTLGNSLHTKTRLFGSLAVGGSSEGASGQVLTSQGAGTAPVWSAVSSLPTQSGNSGKFLTTDGSNASWATVNLSAYLDSTTAASTYLTQSSAASTYQPLDGDLTSIAGLTGTTGLLKKTAANTWTLDTTAYGTGSVTSVGVSVPTGLSVSGTPVTTSGTIAISLTSGYSIPTTASQTNWDTAYTDRNKWDGGSTGLVAATGRTSLGATTVGSNLFTLTNPSAVTFLRFNADNTVSALDAATFRTAIGAGTSSTTGTVTSVSGTGTVSGLTLTGSVTGSGSLTLGGAITGFLPSSGGTVTGGMQVSGSYASNVQSAPLQISGSGVWNTAFVLNNTGTGGNAIALFSTNSSFSQLSPGFLVYNNTTSSNLFEVSSSNAKINGSQILLASNYTSYSPSLTGSGASGTWGVRVTGFANAGSPRLYSTDSAYNYDAANPYYGYLTYDGSRWLFQVSPGTPAAVRVSYADSAGSAATATRTSGVSGYAHAGTGMYPFYNWGGNNGGTGAPSDSTYTVGISVGSHPGDQAYGVQIGRQMWNDGIWVRGYDSGWRSWYRVLDSSNYTSYTVNWLGDNYNSNNRRLYGPSSGSMGLLGTDSAGSFRWQLYGDGTNYGLLDSAWGNWDIKKAPNGNMTLRVSSTDYTVYHTGNMDAPNKSGTSYYQMNTWMQVNSGAGGYGFYFPYSGGGTHFYPNGNSYGSFYVEGARNTYYGIMYGTGVGTAGWMTNGNTSGYYNHSYGWKYYHESGQFYIYTGTYGGGSGYVALHSGNYTSYMSGLSTGWRSSGKPSQANATAIGYNAGQCSNCAGGGGAINYGNCASFINFSNSNCNNGYLAMDTYYQQYACYNCNCNCDCCC